MPRHLDAVLDDAGLTTAGILRLARLNAFLTGQSYDDAAKTVASVYADDPAEQAALVSLMVEQREAY